MERVRENLLAWSRRKPRVSTGRNAVDAKYYFAFILRGPHPSDENKIKQNKE